MPRKKRSESSTSNNNKHHRLQNNNNNILCDDNSVDGVDGDLEDCDDASLHNGHHPLQRNAANARERARMRVLSRAFCRLKTTLPWVPADTKLSKLDTLRLATSYIAHLRDVLLLPEAPAPSSPPNPLNLTWPFGGVPGAEPWITRSAGTSTTSSSRAFRHVPHQHQAAGMPSSTNPSSSGTSPNASSSADDDLPAHDEDGADPCRRLSGGRLLELHHGLHGYQALATTSQPSDEHLYHHHHHHHHHPVHEPHNYLERGFVETCGSSAL